MASQTPIHRLFFSPEATDNQVSFGLQFDSDKIVASQGKCVTIWDIKSGLLRAKLEGHTGTICAMKYLDNIAVSASTDGTARIWDLREGICVRVLEHGPVVRSVEILPRDTIAEKGSAQQSLSIITGTRHGEIRLWNFNSELATDSHEAKEPPQPHTMRGHEGSIRALAADNNTLISGSADCSVRIWNLSTRKFPRELRGHTNTVLAVALDSKQNRCMSGSADGTVKIWSLEDGNLLHDIQNGISGICGLHFYNGLLAFGSSKAQIWDSQMERIKDLSQQVEDKGIIDCLCHNGEVLVCGFRNALKAYDMKTGTILPDLAVGLEHVYQVRMNTQYCVAALSKPQVGVVVEVRLLMIHALVLRSVLTSHRSLTCRQPRNLRVLERVSIDVIGSMKCLWAT